jgi:hypothetical protein
MVRCASFSLSLSPSLFLSQVKASGAEVGGQRRDMGSRRGNWILDFCSFRVSEKTTKFLWLPEAETTKNRNCLNFPQKKKTKRTHKRERAIAFFFYRAHANDIFSRVSSVSVVRAERGETRQSRGTRFLVVFIFYIPFFPRKVLFRGYFKCEFSRARLTASDAVEREIWLWFCAVNSWKRKSRSTRAMVNLREWLNSRVNFARISINLFITQTFITLFSPRSNIQNRRALSSNNKSNGSPRLLLPALLVVVNLQSSLKARKMTSISTISRKRLRNSPRRTRSFA